MGKKHRYPGSKPFTESERDLFFGRDEDIDRLVQLLTVEKLLVLYGKSGLGKSSIINAGIVPRFESSGDFDVIQIRFGSYQKDSHTTTPLNSTLRIIRRNQQTNCFLRKIRRDNHSIWQSLKSIQINSYNQDKGFVLVFDQFEELFTYPDSEVRIFKEQLSELLSGKIPKKFRSALREKMDEDDHVLDKEEMGLLYKKLPIKIMIAIRSDKMSLLNRLKVVIPNILQKSYELKALTREQAEDAILNPAEIRDEENFEAPPFDYSDEALDKILDYLTKRNEKNIESFQLQILCQYVEENMVIKRHDTNISGDDLGDLENIYQNYYDNQIEKIKSPQDQAKARKLIEEGLIFEPEERRLSLYEGQIRNVYKIDDELLTSLADTHLLRAENSPSGGFSYEISHDTLVAPILKSKTRRTEEEQREERNKKRQEEQEAIIAEKQRKLMRRGMWVVLFLLAVVVALLVREYVRTQQMAGDQKKAAERLRKANDQLAKEKKNLKQTSKQLEDYLKSSNSAIKKENFALKQQIEELNGQLEDLSATTSTGSTVADELEKLKKDNNRLRAGNKRLSFELTNARKAYQSGISLLKNDYSGIHERLDKKLFNTVPPQMSNKFYNELKKTCLGEMDQLQKKINGLPSTLGGYERGRHAGGQP